MAQTLETYTDLVQVEVDDTSTSTEGLLQEFIKEIYQEIMAFAAKYLATSTTADTVVTIGDATHVPTNEFYDILTVHYKQETSDNFNLLRQTTRENYLESHINDDDGTPTQYFIEGNTVHLIPAPIDAGTLRVTSIDIQPELSTTSIIPDRFTRVVVLGAAWRYKAWDDNPAATEYERYYKDAFKMMLDELTTKTKMVQPALFNRRRLSR